MNKITLGISGQALGDVRSFAEIVDIAERFGIRNFELWPVNVPGNGFGYRERDMEPILAVRDEKKIDINVVTVEAAFCEDAVKTPEIYTDILCSAIDAAAMAGAKIVNHYCYYINLDEKPDYERLDRFWGPSLDYARRKGITLVLENEAHDVTRNPETTAEIMRHFDDPCFLTNLDAANYFHASREGFPAAYEILKPWIGYIHLKNACLFREGAGQPEENRGAPMSGLYAPQPVQYAPLPEGSVNISGLISAVLADGRYQGIMTLEPHTVPENVENFYRIETEWLAKLGFID
ncbi:MAG: TIM barrel protein [Blautia sp.]|nr:TIM barrel protein [Blautia sp.]